MRKKIGVVPSADRRGELIGAGSARSTVVVIDDEPSIRTLVRMLLDRSDLFEVAGEAANGLDGVDVVRATQPDIVLLDLLMPGAGGRDVLPQIISDSPRSMVVVLSALSSVDQAEGTFSDGAFAYVEKSALSRLPDVIVELRAMFSRALAGHTVWAPGDMSRVMR